MTDNSNRVIRHIPDAAWDAAMWIPGGSWVEGSIDPADRLRIVRVVLEAAHSAHPAEEQS